MCRSNRASRLSKKPRIFLVDDHEVIRFALKSCINLEKDLEVCGEADTAAEAFEKIPLAKPDLAVVDIGLEDASGIELTRNLRIAFPKILVIVFSMQSETVYGPLALRAGASGYVMKNQGMPVILAAMRKVLGGGIYLSEKLSADLLQAHVRGRSTKRGSLLPDLSERELEVFRLISEWKSTGEIARQLHLSVKTVEYYREQIKKKLNLKDGSELMRCALEWFE